MGRRQQQRVPAQAQEAREHPQKTWPQCLQWCLRTTTEKSVLHSLHQNTALSLTQRGPFSLCFGCWNFFRGLPQSPHARQGRWRRVGGTQGRWAARGGTQGRSRGAGLAGIGSGRAVRAGDGAAFAHRARPRAPRPRDPARRVARHAGITPRPRRSRRRARRRLAPHSARLSPAADSHDTPVHGGAHGRDWCLLGLDASDEAPASQCCDEARLSNFYGTPQCAFFFVKNFYRSS